MPIITSAIYGETVIKYTPSCIWFGWLVSWTSTATLAMASPNR